MKVRNKTTGSILESENEILISTWEKEDNFEYLNDDELDRDDGVEYEIDDDKANSKNTSDTEKPSPRKKKTKTEVNSNAETNSNEKERPND